jgi:hypothetical protein
VTYLHHQVWTRTWCFCRVGCQRGDERSKENRQEKLQPKNTSDPLSSFFLQNLAKRAIQQDKSDGSALGQLMVYLTSCTLQREDKLWRQKPSDQATALKNLQDTVLFLDEVVPAA